jgi:hypothetical protein
MKGTRRLVRYLTAWTPTVPGSVLGCLSRQEGLTCAEYLSRYRDLFKPISRIHTALSWTDCGALHRQHSADVDYQRAYQSRRPRCESPVCQTYSHDHNNVSWPQLRVLLYALCQLPADRLCTRRSRIRYYGDRGYLGRRIWRHKGALVQENGGRQADVGLAVQEHTSLRQEEGQKDGLTRPSSRILIFHVFTDGD